MTTTTTIPRLTPADRVRPTSHADHQAAYQARLAAIHATHAESCEELDRERTRAIVAREKALKAVNVEHAAEAVRRQEAAHRFVMGILSPRVEHFMAQHNHPTASALAGAFRVAEDHLVQAE